MSLEVKLRRESVLKDGYIAKQEKGELILLSCGSELQHALAAAEELGKGPVSSRCPASNVSPARPRNTGKKFYPINAGSAWRSRPASPQIWSQYVRLDGKIIRIERFGLSAPGNEAMKELGIDAQHGIDAAKSLG